MFDSYYNLAINKIKECRDQLKWLETHKDEVKNYQKMKDDIEYELQCWKNQLDFGTVSIW